MTFSAVPETAGRVSGRGAQALSRPLAPLLACALGTCIGVRPTVTAAAALLSLGPLVRRHDPDAEDRERLRNVIGDGGEVQGGGGG
ncbi:hypothetical protein ACNPQM_18720 [Streptomyces sp. NPDC056231]|uniref:hypothetical protein n=1 Tax=Streptomyces sp. NPDC056231 TaxID=3345755 RepID=UPI003AB02D6B